MLRSEFHLLVRLYAIIVKYLVCLPFDNNLSPNVVSHVFVANNFFLS